MPYKPKEPPKNIPAPLATETEQPPTEKLLPSCEALPESDSDLPLVHPSGTQETQIGQKTFSADTLLILGIAFLLLQSDSKDYLLLLALAYLLL